MYRNDAVGKKASPLPVEEYHLGTPLKDYDLNFCFPVKILESNGLRMEPLIPSLHGAAAWDIFKTEAGQAMYRFIPFSAPKTFAEWLTQEEAHRRDPGWVTFALLDKSWAAGPRLAGTISLLNTSAENCCAEVGAVYIFPEFQRTHVNTHATSLLLQWGFEELGLRRMTWRANALNLPSVSAAKRFGFMYEGRMLWDRVLPHENEGDAVYSKLGLGSPKAGPGRHSEQLAINWSAWENEGVKEHIEGLMAREVKAKH